MKSKKLIRKLKRSNERLWAAIRVLQHRVDVNQDDHDNTSAKLHDATKNGTMWREGFERNQREMVDTIAKIREQVDKIIDTGNDNQQKMIKTVFALRDRVEALEVWSKDAWISLYAPTSTDPITTDEPYQPRRVSPPENGKADP